MKPATRQDDRARSVNIAIGSDGASTSGTSNMKETTTDAVGKESDAAVFAKMDNLQNQLNQVMLML